MSKEKKNCSNTTEHGGYTCTHHNDKTQLCKDLYEKFNNVIVETLKHKQVISYKIVPSNYSKQITFICKHDQICCQTMQYIMSNRCCRIGGDIKRKITNVNKYGVECVFQNEEIKEKSKVSMLVNTGYVHNSQNPELMKQRIRTVYKNAEQC